MKATVTEDAAGLRWEIKDDGSEDYRKAVELTCLKPAAWIPVSERLPPEESVVVWDSENRIAVMIAVNRPANRRRICGKWTQ